MYLHPCCTSNQHFTAIISIACDKATFHAATMVNMLQSISILCRVVTYVTANVNNRCHVTCQKQNKASLRAKKKKYFFIHTKSPTQVVTHASTLSLCLSHYVNCATARHFQALSKHVTVPRRLCMKQDNSD